MHTESGDELIQVVRTFLRDYNPTIVNIGELKAIEVTNTQNNQCLTIQTADETSLWVRLREPSSSYYCESFEEFELFTTQLLTNKIEIAIGFSANEWKETEIVYKNEYSNLNPDFEYLIAAWDKKPTK